MIEIAEIKKSLGSSIILKDISFNVQEGSILGLIGPNGAGKTTLIKILVGIWKAENGHVKFDNSEVFDNVKIKEKIGYVPDYCHYYDWYKIEEIIKIYKSAYSRFNEEKFYELSSLFKIENKKRIRALSKGNKTMLMLILALCVMPKYIILDEPTSGLDAITKRKLIEILIDDVSQRKTTVFLSTHNILDIEQLCDHIAIINSGEIKFQGTIDKLKSEVTKYRIAFKNGLPDLILENNNVLDVKNIGNVYEVVTRKQCFQFEEDIKKNGANVIDKTDISLEDIFIYMLGGNKIC